MNSMRKNFLYNIIYQILIIILPLITTPYISRVLGANGVGVYSYTFSTAHYFLLIGMLGINNYGSRSIAKVRDDKKMLSQTFWSIYAIEFIASLLSIIAYITYLVLFASSNELIALIQTIYLVSGVLDINWFFFGLEKFKLTVTRNIIIKLLTVCLIFIFVRSESDLWIYTLILTTGSFLSQFMMWGFINKFICFEKTTLKAAAKHIKPMLLLFVPVIAISIYKIMDKIMIGAMSSMTEVGFYSNAEKIITIPAVVVTALGTVMLPRMSNLVSKGNVQKSKEYINISLQSAVFLSSAMAFGMAGIAPIFTPIFFGEEFSVSGNIITYLAPTVLFTAWASVIRTQYLIPNVKDRPYVVSVVIGAIVNVIFNFLLIPKYGAVGATVGTVCAEIIVAVYQTISARRDLEIGLYLKNCIIFCVAGILMFMVVRIIGFAMGMSVTTLFVQIILGGAIYLAICLIYYYATEKQKVINIIIGLRKTQKLGSGR